MTANRSTVETWVRKLEAAADGHDDSSTFRAFTFREILAAAWADGWGRGYDDCRDDTERAAGAARRAVRENASARPEEEH